MQGMRFCCCSITYKKGLGSVALDLTTLKDGTCSKASCPSAWALHMAEETPAEVLRPGQTALLLRMNLQMEILI